MIGRYDHIDKVTLKAEGSKYDNITCYFLTGNKVDDAPGGFEVDLTGDCCFNEFELYTREKVADVSSVDDIIKFAKEHNKDNEHIIKLYTDKNHPENLIVGGEKDMVILSDLQFAWAENLDLEVNPKEIKRYEAVWSEVSNGFWILDTENDTFISLPEDIDKKVEDIMKSYGAPCDKATDTAIAYLEHIANYKDPDWLYDNVKTFESDELEL